MTVRMPPLPTPDHLCPEWSRLYDRPVSCLGSRCVHWLPVAAPPSQPSERVGTCGFTPACPPFADPNAGVDADDEPSANDKAMGIAAHINLLMPARSVSAKVIDGHVLCDADADADATRPGSRGDVRRFWGEIAARWMSIMVDAVHADVIVRVTPAAAAFTRNAFPTRSPT